ncbi:arylsulfatase [Maribacter sp. 2307UL18-2]|uniref:arylsulfatase n=1 Tax=Maribacter sp. 2307UL18-2 TaxID=3386274 RepID=UPI0039BC9789
MSITLKKPKMKANRSTVMRFRKFRSSKLFPLGIIVCLYVVSCCTSRTQTASANKAPNVILIVTDDQGYGDLSCHGNPYIKTPNIDRLYKESVRFTDFHVDPTCASTRAALMTGKYSHHVGVWHTVSGGNHLRTSEITMADIFKSSGYRTGLFGKWHLGSNYPYRPMDRGFDEWLGQGDGGTGTTDDWFDNDRVNDHYWYNGKREKRSGFAPDVFYAAAIDFIKKDHKENTPFFIYLPTYLPHDPHTLPNKSLADNDNAALTKEVSYFFAGIEQIDWNINRLRKALEESDQAKNTIIVFMSDNGGTAGVKLFNAGMRGYKGQVYEGGHRVPFFIHWPEGQFKSDVDVKALTAHIDVLPTLIELCDLKLESEIDFDGRSFKQQLFDSELELSARTLFVETQRTYKAKPWVKTVGMHKQWRLVDNKELYNLQDDPAQKKDCIGEHPEVIENIRNAHKKYWSKVTPMHRVPPCPIVGHPNDPETFLSPSDWYLPKVPWNHAQVAMGSPEVGEWHVNIINQGKYRFEVRRWPREANAAIQGIPIFTKKVDAWGTGGPIEKLIYGNQMNPLPVRSIKLDVGKFSEIIQVGSEDKKVVFEMSLPAGNTKIKGTMLDGDNQIIAGTYYIYMTRLQTLVRN